jgi:hypothetical protein
MWISDAIMKDTHTPKICLKRSSRKIRAGKVQPLKMMGEDKFCKLKNGIFLRGRRKPLWEFIMNARSTILRICLIQSFVSSWFRLGGIRKACMFENEKYHYFWDQKLQRQTAEIYQSVCGEHGHH